MLEKRILSRILKFSFSPKLELPAQTLHLHTQRDKYTAISAETQSSILPYLGYSERFPSFFYVLPTEMTFCRVEQSRTNAR